MIAAGQIINGNIEKAKKNSGGFLQMRCTSLCSQLFFHAEAGIALNLFLNFEQK